MRSLRARLTAAFAALLAATVLLFAGAILAVRRDTAVTNLQRQVLDEADLAVRLLRQASALPDGNAASNAPGGASGGAARTSTAAFLRATLEGFPSYLLVLDDSGRVAYASFLVRQLAQDDLAQLLSASLDLSERRPALKVTLAQDQVVIVSRPVTGAPVRVARVVAGASTAPLAIGPAEFLGQVLFVAPLLLLAAVGVAWWLVGDSLRPVDRLIADAEAISDGRSLHRRLSLPDGLTPDDELGRLATTLNEMIGRLEGSFAALRRFTADASHELKTPLTVLRADIERAMATTGNPGEQLVALEEAIAELARMTSLVDSLLTLARADEGRFDLARDRVRMEPIVRDVYETALILGEEAGLSVELPIVEDAEVLGDPSRLRQLCLNLVTNAIKYTPRGGRVELTLSRRLDGIAFSVKDTGIGIAAADLPFVFDRFWRADRARTRTADRGGAGLGLAIAQWIAQAHGGTLTVQSRLGRGSIFTATFPVVGEPAGRAEVPSGTSNTAFIES